MVTENDKVWCVEMLTHDMSEEEDLNMPLERRHIAGIYASQEEASEWLEKNYDWYKEYIILLFFLFF